MSGKGRRNNKPRLAVRGRGRATGAIRRNRNATVANIRPKKVMRASRGVTTSINLMRKFVIIPPHMKSDGTLGEQWWLQGLKWFATLVMHLLTTATTAAFLEQHLTQYPLPKDHPLSGRLLAGSIPTGTVVRILLGPEDLAGDSELIDLKGATPMMHYREAKIDWIRVLIQPVTSNNSRGGMIAAALESVPQSLAVADDKAKNKERITFYELLRTPGVLYKTANTPTTLTFSPKPTDETFMWQKVGAQTDQDYVIGKGGDARYVLTIGYQNLTSDISDQSTHYTLSTAELDVTVESRINFREYDDGVMVRSTPVTVNDPTTITDSAYGVKSIVSLNNVYVHHGVFIYEDTLRLEDMAM